MSRGHISSSRQTSVAFTAKDFAAIFEETCRALHFFPLIYKGKCQIYYNSNSPLSFAIKSVAKLALAELIRGLMRSERGTRASADERQRMCGG